MSGVNEQQQTNPNATELAKTQELSHTQTTTNLSSSSGSHPSASTNPTLAPTRTTPITQTFSSQQPPLIGSPSTESMTSDTSGAAAAHPQLIVLRKIDALSEKLQKEGKLLEALQAMEKSLILRGHIFGLDSIEVFRACKSVGEMCNYLAMTMLQQDLFDVTLELLKKAEVLTERHKAVRAVTFNNLACYYRKRGKLRTALNYCRKALGLEAKMNENVKSADTHLNMCTILSELKRHEKAIVHARIALKLLLLELFGDFDQLQQQQQQGSEQEHEAIATGTSEVTRNPTSMESLRAKLPADRVAVLAIAYHNKAVQEEFLRKYRESLISYEKATKVVTTHLGPSHPLVTSLTESYKAAQKKMEAKLKRQQESRTTHASNLGANKQPSRLEQQQAKSAKNLHSQLQQMPDSGFSDGEYDSNQVDQGGFQSD